jgi:toxin ParE1/3/4
MAIFTLTEKANSDLKDIARFTQKRWGHDQRNKYLKDLDACFFRLAENPSLGRVSQVPNRKPCDLFPQHLKITSRNCPYSP